MGVVSYVRPIIESELDAAAGKVVGVGRMDDGEVDAAITGGVAGEVQWPSSKIQMLGRTCECQLKKHKRG